MLIKLIFILLFIAMFVTLSIHVFFSYLTTRIDHTINPYRSKKNLVYIAYLTFIRHLAKPLQYEANYLINARILEVKASKENANSEIHKDLLNTEIRSFEHAKQILDDVFEV